MDQDRSFRPGVCPHGSEAGRKRPGWADWQVVQTGYNIRRFPTACDATRSPARMDPASWGRVRPPGRVVYRHGCGAGNYQITTLRVDRDEYCLRRSQRERAVAASSLDLTGRKTTREPAPQIAAIIPRW